MFAQAGEGWPPQLRIERTASSANVSSFLMCSYHGILS
jgi:hypothetical protein